MDYLDFEVQIAAGVDNRYPVTVIHAAAGGEPSTTALIPITDETLRRQLDELIGLRHAMRKPRRSVTTVSSSLPSFPALAQQTLDEQHRARAIGQRLFDALIVGGVRDAYSSSLVRAREQGAGLRLRLRIEAPEVAALPWELLYDAQEGDHVCLLRETPLTRYIALSRDRDVLTVKPPLRILGMVAAPSGLPYLEITAEQARIEHALEYRLERGDVELQWVAGSTWQARQTALAQGPWHIFHFIGHGNFDPMRDEGYLVLCNPGNK
ncbi:MAG: CHAT domain-containing protein, partial [Caldilineaceae bacterium]|nr:CHAT domain-containing protein [Caldilineaceae bacterium]